MLIRIPRSWEVKSSEITAESVYRDRRRFMKTAGLATAGLALSPGLLAAKPMGQLEPLGELAQSRFSTDEERSSYEDITSYNNFYEFGADKGDPARLAPDLLEHEPWSVEVSGEAEKTGKIGLEDLLKPHALEGRIYRLRCVEA